MELKVEQDKVLAAAKDCPDADKVLRKLFPAAFRDEINLRKLQVGAVPYIFTAEAAKAAGIPQGLIQVRHGGGPNDGTTFYLDPTYDFSIEQEPTSHVGITILKFKKKSRWS